jgi:hypothetical protein
MAHGCPLTRAAFIQRGLEVIEVSDVAPSLQLRLAENCIVLSL